MNVQWTHVFAADHLQDWLAEHALDADHIRDITIHIAHNGVGVGAWAHVTWYKVDPKGLRYMDPVTQEAAIGEVDVPLRSLPRLVPRSE